MKRIIEISEEDFNHLCFLHEDDIYKIVENSTPLNECETDDCIKRSNVFALCNIYLKDGTDNNIAFFEHLLDLPSVAPKSNTVNCTNGDMIKSMFPNLQGREKAFEIEVNVNKNKVGNISVDWWNAPYKGVTDNETNN